MYLHHHDDFCVRKPGFLVQLARNILTYLLNLLPLDPTMATPADLQSAVDTLKGVITAFPTQALNDSADAVVAFIGNLPAGTDLQPFVDAVNTLKDAAQAENDAAAAVVAKLQAAVQPAA